MTDDKSNRNARWFAEVVRVKEGLGVVSMLMKPAVMRQLPKDMPLVDLFKEYRRVHDKWFNEEEAAKISAFVDTRCARALPYLHCGRGAAV